MAKSKTVEQISMSLITFAGLAKSFAIQAIEEAEKGKKDVSKILIEADKNLKLANKEHFAALQQDIKGELKISVLFIHAEDQMLNAETIILLAQKIINIHMIINK